MCRSRMHARGEQPISSPAQMPGSNAMKRASMRDFTRTLWMVATAFCLVAAPYAREGSHAAPVCEAGKGYVAADTAQQVNENFLTKIKAIGIDTVIRYYDWTDETLPGKTLNLHELALIGK